MVLENQYLLICQQLLEQITFKCPDDFEIISEVLNRIDHLPISERTYAVGEILDSFNNGRSTIEIVIQTKEYREDVRHALQYWSLCV